VKNHNITKPLLAACLAIVCGISSNAIAAPPKSEPAKGGGDATIAITRAPSVGSGIFVAVSADGKQLATLTQGRRYSGTIAAGKHTLMVIPDPNLAGQRPFKMDVDFEKGKAYVFTTTRKSGDIILVRTQ
jgi:hypothetical protein